MIYTIIYFIAVDIAALSMIFGVTLFPWKFNRQIIPEIEQKLGKKLEYNESIYAMMPTGKYMRYVEIGGWIVQRYLLRKWGKDETKYCRGTYALYKANYQVEQFSRKEIFWSMLAVIDLLSFVILGIIFMVMNH